MDNRKNFLRGAALLSVAGVISKVLGALYRIPLARMIGEEGIGLYQMAYPIYTAIISLATAGIPVAISVLVARKVTQGYDGDERKIFKVSLAIMTVFGLLLSGTVMLNAGWLANNLLVDARSYYPIMAVAPAIFFASLMSVFRGYFQGHQTMLPTAISQVVEQIFRVAAILCMAILLFPRGLEFAAAGAASGAVFGGVAGLILLLVFYLLDRKKKSREHREEKYSDDSRRQVARDLIRLAIPISLGAVVFPLVQMVDTAIVPRRLAYLGYSPPEATALFGLLSGMAATLISLPTIFTIAISTSLVPAVSEAFSANAWKLLHERINNALRAGMIISLPAAAGMFILAGPICTLLYGSPDAGIPLRPLAFSAIMLGAFQISSSSLQAMGHPEIAMRNLVLTGGLKIIFNYTLTGVAVLNIQGAAIGTVMAFFFGSLLNLISLKALSHIRYETRRFGKITLISAFMALGAGLSYRALIAHLAGNWATVLAITIGVAIYGVLMLATKELDARMLRRLIGK
jgi:stage V sporulation protein B